MGVPTTNLPVSVAAVEAPSETLLAYIRGHKRDILRLALSRTASECRYS